MNIELPPMLEYYFDLDFDFSTAMFRGGTAELWFGGYRVTSWPLTADQAEKLQDKDDQTEFIALKLKELFKDD